MAKLKENCYIIYFWEEDEEKIVKMYAVETHIRKVYMRIFAGIRGGLKLIDMYRVNDTIKKWSKSYFREMIERDLIQMTMGQLIKAHEEGKTSRIDEHLIHLLEAKIKNDPIDRK